MLRSLGLIAFALVLHGILCGPARAGEAEPPVIRRIGTVTVVTPSAPGVAPRPVFRRSRVRRWLQRLVGELFQEERARSLVARHYRFLGYDPVVTVSLRDGVLDLEVVEARGVVGSVAVGPEALERRMPARLFRRMEPVRRPGVPSGALRTRPGDLINREKIARDAYDLSLLGYDLVPVPGAEGDYAVTRLARLRDWRRVKERLPEDQEPPIQPFRRQWVGVEAEYTRRSLFVARVFYTRAHLFREFDTLEISPYVAQEPAGAIRYRIPYLLPSARRMNLFADVKVYDEFVPDRLLDGVQTDERRVGGRIALGLEPLRHARGHTLSAEAWMNRYHVDFGRFEIPINGGPVIAGANVPGGSLNDVHLLGVGMDWRIGHEYRAPRFWWRFLPMVEVATKALGGDIAFRRMSGELKQHYAWSTGFEIDLSWKGGMTDREVPVFEQFALGGADSVRGFLRDDFIGRNFWSAQHDVWIPFPFRAFGRDSRLLASLQRNLKTAVILDMGSISLDETLDAAFARGIGLGLRWKSEGSPLVVKVDAAWGRWERENSFYPYVSFGRTW